MDPLGIISLINPSKDVDGFSPYNAGLVQVNSSDAIIAATPKGILAMLNSIMPDLSGKHAVVIGRSNIVGKPLASLLLNQDCTLSVVHSKTKDIKDVTGMADILISACGVPGLVNKSWVKKGAVVIDVGISRVGDKIRGDVDFEEVSEIASYISPVPGGVGPMTIAMLLDNLYKMAVKKGRV
jgi:methylenetetrahydrofolate dehydrogenase (NADP+)/methenyltetrahydrofolate cyclohydrolase